MTREEAVRHVKKYLTKLEAEKFTGKIIFKFQFNQGGVRGDGEIERTEKVHQN